MDKHSPLDDWRFLEGSWKGRTEAGQFGVKEVMETSVEFTLEPSDQFLMAREVARSGGNPLHTCIRLLFFDEKMGAFKRRSFFSDGFVDNETECARTEGMIEFDVVHDPAPEQ